MKNRLRVLRAEREWTQADLAKHVGVSRQAILAVENGKYEPGLSFAFRIARAFGKTVDDVFIWEDDDEKSTSHIRRHDAAAGLDETDAR